MVKKIFGIVNREISGLHEAAYLLGVFALLSQLLALVRDRLLAGTFGASEMLDIYYASFRLPDLIFVVSTMLVSAAVLIPMISDKLESEDETRKIVNSVFSVFLIFSFLICAIVFLFTPFFLKIFVPGINSAEGFTQLVSFTRLLLLSPIFLGISQLLGGVVQAYKRFFIYAVSPILYNIGIIIGVAFLYPVLGPEGLVWGVILGSLMHLLIQVPYIYSKKLVPKLTLSIDWDVLKKIILISAPRSIALASSQILMLFLVAISSTMMVGSITIFSFSYNLQSVPMAIIGVSYSLAAFPTLSRLFASGQREEFYAKIITAIKHIIFWSLPVMALFIVLRAQIVRTILGTGAFDWQDTRLTAAALSIFSISVVAQSLTLLFVRSYYSAKRTLTPVIINVISFIITLVFAFLLNSFYETNSTFRFFFESIFRVYGIDGTEILMLPLAYSVGAIINTFILWIYFEKDFAKISDKIWPTLRDSFITSIIIGYVSYVGLQVFDDLFNMETLLGIFLQGFCSGVIGILFGLLTLIILGNNEIVEVWKTLNHKFWRKVKPISEGQEEL